MPNITIRIDDEWASRLEKLLRDLGHNPERERSRLIRDLISREFQYWQFSPYISFSRRCRVLVCREGTIFYWIQQHLYLVEAREYLPCSVFMKPEKKQYFENSEKRGRLAERICDNWLINYFNALFVRGDKKELLADGVDHNGITAKYVDLCVKQGQDTNLVREIMVSTRDYVQWRTEDDSSVDDRVDIYLDIPTTNLEIQVMVDLDLYREDEGLAPTLKYEIRNRELARFRESELKTEKNSVMWIGGDSTEKIRGKKFREAYGEVQDGMKFLIERIGELVDANTLNGEPVIDKEEKRGLLRNIRFPERFLFGRLRWQKPYQNLVISPSWNKPRSNR